MEINDNNIAAFLNTHALFAGIDSVELSRIVPLIKIISTGAQDSFLSQDDVIDNIYIIVSGEFISSKDHENTHLFRKGMILGAEGLFGAVKMSATVTPNVSSVLVQIPLSVAQHLAQISPGFLARVYQMNKSGYIEAPANPSPPYAPVLRIILAWIFTFLGPIIVYSALHQLSFAPRIYLSTFVGAMILWAFDIVYIFVPALLILLVALVVGIVPNDVILSGFTSDSFLLLLCFTGITSAIISSRIVDRIMAVIVRYLPHRRGWYSTALFVLGILITPFIPSVRSRIQLFAQGAKLITHYLKLQNSVVVSTKITIAGLYGSKAFNRMFFTGAILNFAAMGLLSKHEQFHIVTVGWFHMALVPAIILLLVNLLALQLLFYTRDKIDDPAPIARQVLKILGPMKKEEWHAIIVLVLFTLLIFTISSHQFQVAWLSLFFFFTLSGVGIVKIRDWAVHTDWSLLFFVCMSLGIAKALNHLELDQTLKSLIFPYIQSFLSNKVYAISVLVIPCIILRFFMQVGPAFVTLMIIALPMSEDLGMDPWIIMFTLLMSCDIWFFSYQHEFKDEILHIMDNNPQFNPKLFWQYNMVMNGARFLSIYLSIPYWRLLGML